MPPDIHCYLVTTIWGERAQMIATNVWFEVTPTGAVALAVQALLRQRPDLPPLIGANVNEITADALENLLQTIKNGVASPTPLDFMKPEGSA